MTTVRSRGRRVPFSPADLARFDRAHAAYQDQREAVTAFAAALPALVRLPDGRTLREADPSELSFQRRYRCDDGMAVIVSLDPTRHGLLRHVSASYRDRAPSWDDLRALRALFFSPDRDVIQVLPRRGEYVNVHEFCHHLFEAPEAWDGGLFV